MNDQTTRDILARLEMQEALISNQGAELTSQRAELATLRTTVAAHERGDRARRRRPQRRDTWTSRLGAALVVALLLATVPASILATDRFPDVPTTNPHHDDIGQIAAAGITTGFPDGTYKPDAFVTRGQIATFLARTAGLGGRTPVVNAATALTATNAANATTAQTAVSAQTADTATNAANAEAVDGKSANEIARVARAVNPNDDFEAVETGAVPTPYITADLPTFETIGTITIQVPGDGFVKVDAATTGVTASGALLFARLRDITPGAPAGARSPILTTQTARSTFLATVISPTYVFPVSGAGTKVFVLEMGTDSASDTDSYHLGTQLTALYVPFGNGGGATLGADEPARPAPARPPSGLPGFP